jgi:poly-gamma-glutamate synthesis protein (capsule biosynthesis protein)
MRRTAARVVLAVTLILCAVACQSAPEAPSAEGDPPDTSPTRTAAAPRLRPVVTQPLVLAMHATRPPVDIPVRLAGRILAGEVRTWEPLDGGRATMRVVAAPGTPVARRLVVPSAGAALHAVTRDRDALAVVPAAAVGPTVQAVDVDGRDPLRTPATYPLTVRATSRQPPVVRLTVAGDIMLGRRVGEIAAQSGDPSLPLRPMQERLAAADITVGNLESTLSRAGSPTQGDDSFAAPPQVRSGLRDAGFDVLGLANNHLGDFGDQALVETVRLLADAGFATFGAGATLADARRPAIVERDGVRFAMVGFNAIGETPEAGPGQPGADSVSMPPRTGPLDRAELDSFLRRVRRLERRVDVVVVMPHWGTQYTNVPEPVQWDVAADLVEAGADLVVGGHPHWVQGAAMIGDRLVVHSLGNFVFDMDFMDQTQVGVLLELTYWGADLKAADFAPYRMDGTFAPRVESHADGRSTLELMWQTSGPAFQLPG